MRKSYGFVVVGTLFLLSSIISSVVRADVIVEPVPDPVLKPCTVTHKPCEIKRSLFGECCSSAGGLGATRPPVDGAIPGDSRSYLPGTDPCGVVTTFGILGSCSGLTTRTCGGFNPSTEDCTYQSPR